jgi:hypothetical protein
MTSGLVGFFHLQTPEDLFRKLQRDYERVEADPASSDAAFDFFITATHIPEWLAKANRPHVVPSGQRDLALLDTCKHLGNGAKHFVVNRHDAVQHGDVGPNTYGSAKYGLATYGATDNLLVTLAPDEASVLGTSQRLAKDLAQDVLSYWRAYLGMP